ncbi:bifunctional 3-(3-hydroxy-phenyl)propionate/3-hydroxycinnamic acid hydroxylase [Paraburkholderia caribensis]|uniref:bifunctional 3-(3-hydroxy-phenyl)propionate/3-hydroxycinnamic acid hydroxylase MhpA n=1 Tax=Paraburkholderia caribensis TaxID=75105 RepID=UPI00285D4A0C|nr:bifunctional 3-(3-hydroxy-phenyl)propionate/3-hydroxycinnamic acid hydroxylase [Paraburkholderia caribensis]MDR6387229.1 2-polyprenyl-6-methoxyphenol hydroxylase-like FAD-dependent oxidoreductase [Paraburkholderia caribensis]
MNQTDFDVAIVGYGPVSQGLAAMLGQRGYRVGVFDRWPNLYPLPRACVIDHEVMRILQSVGVAEKFAELAVPTAGEYVWLTARGETLYHFRYNKDGVSGWPARNLMYQPDLERLLDERVRELPSVEVNQGWEAVAYVPGSDHDELEFAQCSINASGAIERGEKTRRVTARYVVGADGANSFIRRAADLPWVDLGFRADWLVVDYRPHNPELELDMPEAGQICDPARPITMMRRMGKKHVRWEMMLLPGETAQDITRPEKVWSLIDRWVKPEDGIIDRAAVYTFRSGVAQNWSRGNAILAGDAAHLMPPFLGQGLCSGMRDALSLFWRLDLVLSGVASAQLMQSYEEERQAHVRTIIDRAVALGKVVCITDAKEAATRDASILAGTAPPIPAFPQLTTGILRRDADGNVELPAGQLALQGRVAIDGKEGLLDDMLGRGWLVLTLDEPGDAKLSDDQQVFAKALGVRFMTLKQGSSVRDVGDASRAFMTGLGVAALIIRPDFYIFAGARSLDQIPQMLDDLRQQLSVDCAAGSHPVAA